MSPQPDPTLEALYDEMEAHLENDTWTKEVFLDLLARAKAAAGEQGDALEFLFMRAPEEWIPDDAPNEDVADGDA